MISFIQQTANIKVYFDKPMFYIGEFIRGNIEINVTSTIIVQSLLIQIKIIENWKVKEGSNEKMVKMFKEKDIINYNLDLKKLKKFQIVDNEIILPSGISFIPFNFRFSEENIPSFEYPLPNKIASIRYKFIVNVNSPNLKGNSSYFICFISRPIIDSKKILTKSINQHIKKWKIFDRGDTVLKVSIPDNNYLYNSNCTVSIEIDNNKGKAFTKFYKIMLIRRIKFKDLSGELKYKDEINIVSEKINAVVAPGDKKSFEYKLFFKEKDTKKNYCYILEQDPYNAQMDKIDYFMPTTHGELIECNYEIKVSLYFDCFVAYNDRPRIIIPIYIVHQLPMDYQLEIQEQIDYENALSKSMQNIKNDSNNIIKNNENNYIKSENNYINNENIIRKENENVERNNIIVNNEEERDSLPSLEAIQNAKKNKNDQNGLIDNDIDLPQDNCPPNVFDSAPIPLPINDKLINNENNNIYPIYNVDNIKNNEIKYGYPINNENNFNYIENGNENKVNNNQNYLNDGNNIIKESPEDFSLFNTDNDSISNKDTSQNKDNMKNDYKNINEI